MHKVGHFNNKRSIHMSLRPRICEKIKIMQTQTTAAIEELKRIRIVTARLSRDNVTKSIASLRQSVGNSTHPMFPTL